MPTKTLFSRRSWHTPLFAILITLLLPSLLLGGCQAVLDGEAAVQAIRQAIKPGAAGADARPTPTFSPSPTPLSSQFKIEPTDLRGVQIRFWHAWGKTGQKVMQSLVLDFNRDNPWGVSVQARALQDYDRLSEELAAALAAQAIPEMVSAYAHQVLGLRQDGLSPLDLAPYLVDPVWGLTAAEQADFIPAFAAPEPAVPTPGLPALRSSSLLVYNRTWAKELGFETPPATPAEFRRQACAAAQAYKNDADRANDGQGGWIISTHYSSILGWLYAFGVPVSEQDLYQFDTPQTELAIRYLRGLLDSGCAWLPESEYTERDFAARRGLFASGSLAGIPLQAAAFADANSQDEWLVLSYPSQSALGAVASYGPDYYVLAQAQDQRMAAWLFIRWLLEPQQQARLAEATAFMPVRIAGLELVNQLPVLHPQWAVAARFADLATNEPRRSSWRVVRWALSDAATQLFRYYFTIDQAPQLARLLQKEAESLDERFR
jgi:ABC-type glycerol-3-phosphate transport system substrate-binding protein